MGVPSELDDLLGRADAARAVADRDRAAALYDEAIAASRAADDLRSWTWAALGAASVHVFGTEPGRLPAQLYDVLVRTTDDADRARVAAALGRCWVYAGEPARGAPFAEEAVTRAERVGTVDLLADALDAALATRWGPDDLAERVALTARLDDVAAHVLDPNTRLQAHLWGLQAACEILDLPSVHRHLRALDRLGEESPRARFFAASRRLMLGLLQGDTDDAPALVAAATEAAEQAALADVWMVIEAMKGYTAAQVGDAAACATCARAAEGFGLAEGVAAVCAEAALLWVHAGDLTRAARLVNTFGGPSLDELPRDVNWLLTLQCVLEAALAVGDRDAIEAASTLLTPYAGRAVINAGAVMFHGVTDDPLSRAAAVLDDAAAAADLRARALATYERIGATWWRDRLVASSPPSGRSLVHFHPGADGVWLVGPDRATVPMRTRRGHAYLRELLRRPGQDVAALDLVTGGTGAVVESGLGEPLDRQAVDAYRARLLDVDEDLAEAEGWSDVARVERLHAERDALLDELAAATGLGGRPRTAGGSSTERARVAATKAITTTIDRIATVDLATGEHLRRSVHTGGRCRYDPPADDRLDWILDA